MKFLLIDETLVLQKILTEVFKNSDIDLILCSTASEGLSKLKSNQFGFICVGMYLEDDDGVSLSKKIRSIKEYTNTPIILLSPKKSTKLYKQALSSGITEVFNINNIPQLVNYIQHFNQMQQPISGRVLYVEDSISQQAIIKSLFIDHGLEVDAFSYAEEAWENYLVNDYDIVVTDIVLEGGMSGTSFTNHIRCLDDEKGEVPVLALTAFDDTARRINLYNIGVSDYVLKPVIEEELIARVRNLIQKQQFYKESIKQKENAEREKQRAEQELLRAEEADKAKSEFLSHMSHELRTPLNAIIGLAKLLGYDKDLLNHDQKTTIKEIMESGYHLLDLINDVLDLSKVESGKLEVDMEPISINDLLPQCLRLVTSQAEERNIKIKDNVSNEGYSVEADYTRLKQVFLNLLSNAVKYNSHHGTITLESEIRNKNTLRIFVSDTGNGLTKSEINKLFTPFERLKVHKHIEGTGIGLIITKHLIEQMGGAIGVKSIPGESATFWFELKLIKQIPSNKDTEEVKTKTQMQSLPKWPKETRLLLVEDNIVNQKVALGVLKQYGLFPDVAINGQDALDKLKQSIDEMPYQLIFMDCSMPEIDGYMCSQMIRNSNAGESYKDITIIAMTANAMQGDREKCLAVGMNDYITKPINPEQIYKKLKKWL